MKNSLRNTFLVHYGELGLKGQNRRDFESRLRKNIKTSLKKAGIEKAKIEPAHRYFTVDVPDTADPQEVSNSIGKTFGVSWFAQAEVLDRESDIQAVTQLVLRLAEPAAAPQKKFKIECKRADKRYPLKSPEIEKLIGQKVIDKTKYTAVDFKKPNHTYYVEINHDRIFVHKDKMRGAGGLPVGTSGRVLVLLSGGIDSPVAAYLMAKRGCNVDFLHFYVNEPKTNSDKILQLTQKIAEFTGPGKLYLAPYLPFNMAILEIDTQYELVLFRRFMLRIAEALCREHGHQAIVTGDSLGQVASQTMENIAATNDTIEETTCFRPLIAMDKEEIIRIAKSIGTFEISNLPDKDCCSIIDRHAKTKVTTEKIRDEEKKLGRNMQKVEKETIEKLRVEVVR